MWFDKDELAAVLEKVVSKTRGKAIGGKSGRFSSGGSWKGHHGVPEWSGVGGLGKW